MTDVTPHMGGVLTGTVVYTTSTGDTWPFSYTGALTATAPYTAYQTPPGLPWQLSTSSTGYTLTNVLNSDGLAFDSQGRYLSTTDAYSNTDVLSYTNGVPTTETNSGGRTLAFSYTNGLLSEAASPLWQGSGGTQGQHVTDGYSGTQLTTQTLGAGTTDALTNTFEYNGTQLVTVTTPVGHVWLVSYDQDNRVTSVTSPMSGTLPTQAGYTPALTTTFSYTSGQTQVVAGAGSSAPLTTTYTLDAQGEPLTVTDGLGDTTGYSYDADHDVLTSRDADGNVSTNFYQYVGPNGSTGLVTETLTPPVGVFYPGDGLTPIATYHVYNASNDLSETDLPGGGLQRYAYDGHHAVITSTVLMNALSPACSTLRRPPGRTVARPDSHCPLTYVWQATVHNYDPYGELVSTVDGRGLDTSQDYTPTISLGTCSSGDGYTCPLSFTSSYTYTTAGDLAQEGTPPIQTTLGVVTTTAPVTTSYSYDADGNRTSLLSANNAGTANATTYGYDHLGRAITTTLPPVLLYTGITTTPAMTTGYDGEGNVVRQIDGNGAVSSSSYDPLGRLVASVNPVGATTLYTYTALEQTAAQDPQGHVTTSAYDPAGRLVLSSDPLGDTTQTQYDAAGNTVAITTGSPLTVTQVQTQGYDALNRVITETISAPGSPPSTTLTAYDFDGNVAQVAQPSGDVTVNSYYPDDQLAVVEVDPATVTAPLGQQVETYSYDVVGNLTLFQDFDGRFHSQSYDAANRAIQATDTYTSTGLLTTTTGYDPDGNVVSQVVTSTSPVAATRSYTAAVNAADWPTSSSDKPMVTSPALVTVYSYDAAGQQRTQTILNSPSTPVTTTLDAEGRATALSEGLNTSSPYTSTYGYNPNDLPVTATLPNGVQTNVGYDPDSRLITTTNLGPTGVVTPLNSSYGYGYNPSSWTSAITSGVSGITSTQVITHDSLGRMVAASSSGVALSWRYDGNGNLLSTTTNGVTTAYSYTAAITPNELLTTTVGAQSSHYSYDQNGDTTGISSTTGISTNLSYDAQARLSAVRLADGTTVVLAYNAQGQRVAYNVSKNGAVSEAEQATYRGDELAQVAISNTQRYTDTYLYDPSGAPLELIRQTRSGSTLSTARYWYVLNGHGDVVALTDISGTVIDSYSYDLWGKLKSSTESVPQRLRYAGYWYDAELGWYWVSVREYNPALMRWLQPDPSQQDGVRRNVYSNNDPIDETDPTGLAGFLPQGWMGYIDQCPNWDPDPGEIVYTPLDFNYVPLGPTRPLYRATNPPFRALGLCAGFSNWTLAPVPNSINQYGPLGVPKIKRGCATDNPLYSQCQRAHMVAASLGGPGIQQNILYTTQRTNTHGFGAIEREIKDLVNRGYVVYYRVSAHYANKHSWAPDHIYVLVTRVNKRPVEGFGSTKIQAEECADAFARIDNDSAGDIINLPLPPDSARCVGDSFVPTD